MSWGYYFGIASFAALAAAALGLCVSAMLEDSTVRHERRRQRRLDRDTENYDLDRWERP